VRLGSEHLRAICAHFEGLDEEGLRLRFGRPMGAEQIRQYVHGLDFARDAVVGLALSSPLPTQARSEERCRQLDDKGSEVPLVGLCHLATVVEGGRLTGDIGISLSPPWRGQGLAGVLLRACLAEAAQRRMSEVCLVYQQHNQRMAALCRRFGASFSHGGGEVEARLAVAAG
jgi:GNAT superfamily N-acetyltransferase